MTNRRVEVFIAGCALCAETVQLVERLACPSCDVTVLNLEDELSARRARDLGVRTVPAVAVDGTLLDCCRRGVEAQALRDAGIGAPIS